MVTNYADVYHLAYATNQLKDPTIKVKASHSLRSSTRNPIISQIIHQSLVSQPLGLNDRALACRNAVQGFESLSSTMVTGEFEGELLLSTI